MSHRRRQDPKTRAAARAQRAKDVGRKLVATDRTYVVQADGSWRRLIPKD